MSQPVSTSEKPDQPTLDDLLKKAQSASPTLLPADLATLISSFIPSQSAQTRSKAYLVLASFTQKVRASSPHNPSSTDPDSLARIFSSPLRTLLSEPSETPVLSAIAFLSALFQVDAPSALAIVSEDGVLEVIMDAVDLPSASAPALEIEVAHLLGHVSAHKTGRALVHETGAKWLSAEARGASDSALRAAAGAALIKLSRGTATDGDESTANDAGQDDSDDAALAKQMSSLVLSTKLSSSAAPPSSSALADAVEGLAYLSTSQKIKDVLAADQAFLSALWALVPVRKRPTTINALATVSGDPSATSVLLYGVLAVAANLAAQPPPLDEEQANIAKLRRMAKPSAPASRAEDDRETPEQVQKRVRALIATGVLDALAGAVALAADTSRAVRVTAGRVYLALVEEQGHRGRVLQAGGAKALLLIIRHTLEPSSAGAGTDGRKDKDKLESVDLDAFQALAKLAITAAPMQVFGTNASDGARPFTLLLTSEVSTLLQRFEALMALTNLASAAPDVVARATGLMSAVDPRLLDKNVRVQRAAAELVCNLVAGSDDAFVRYTAGARLQVLLALSDAEDDGTRSAAAGALAVLLADRTACEGLQKQVGAEKVCKVLALLVDPSAVPDAEDDAEEHDPGLTHRGVVCARHFFVNCDKSKQAEVVKAAISTGLAGGLANLMKGSGPDTILAPTLEALKWLQDASK